MAAEAWCDYLGAMPLPRPASPRVLWNDLRAFWRERPRHQWLAAVLAVSIPAGIIVVFYLDGQTNIMPGERLIYIESWPATRTDDEIKAKQRVDLERRERFEAERRGQFQRLDENLNRLGI